MTYLLGIDAGTTSVKAGVFSPEGRCVGLGRQEYQLRTPAPDRAELDPEEYWSACQRSVTAALSASKVKPRDVRALAVSSQGETIITLDSRGAEIFPALVWIDNRAQEQAARLAQQFAEVVYSRTGIPEILPTWSACKILWIRENDPDVFGRAAKFLLVQDYLIYRLTGKFVTDRSVSCTSLNFDLVNDRWWTDMQDAIGIRQGQLPEIVQPGAMVGTITDEAARQLGLEPGTGVVTGGMDQSVGAIGAGNIEPGVVSESTGAALVVQATILDPMGDSSHTVPVYCHSIQGRYLFAPVCPTAGMALKWIRDAFFQDAVKLAEAAGTDPYDRLTALAEGVPAGSDGLLMLPHLMGAFSPEPNALARGSFTGFTLSHTRAHFVRALLEAVAFLLRRNLDMIESTGMAIREIRSTGGGARSRLWSQIKADVCNRPVIPLANEETALLGDAVLAGVASGAFESAAQGVAAMVETREPIRPGNDVGAYSEAYGSYCDLDRRLAEFFVDAYSRKN